VEQQRDYQGRSFMHTTVKPRAVAAAPPAKMLHAMTGHKAGVQCLAWVPPVGHLLLSGDLDGTLLLWDVLGDRRRIAAYNGHTAGIKSLCFAQGVGGAKFSSAGADGLVHEWSTETGAVLNTLRYKDQACTTHTYHAESDRQIFAGVGRRIVQWDTRVAGQKPVREYDGHQGAVTHVAMLAGGTRFMSSSEDKTVRTWDTNSSVAIQDFADPTMHAVPHFAQHPVDGCVAGQSLDNRVVVFDAKKGGTKFKIAKDRAFTGHSVSGSACHVAFSPDGRYLSSGDVRGFLRVWDWATGETVKAFRAHSKVLNAHLWHPTEPSLVATSAWDGVIKLFA
jgi:pre-mRNA-processing factor 17